MEVERSATDAGLWLCEYCDHAPYHSAKLLGRHMEREHTDDGIALFNRDMTYRQLTRRASRIAKVVIAVTSFNWDDAYNACYDSLIDLLVSGQPLTNRNIRRGAYRTLLNEHETSLDEMMLDNDDADDSDVFAASHAYAIPDAQYAIKESLLEVATGKFDIESPMLWLDVAEQPRNVVLLTGYDALLANTEDALEARQLANRKADERRGRPRKVTTNVA